MTLEILGFFLAVGSAYWLYGRRNALLQSEFVTDIRWRLRLRERRKKLATFQNLMQVTIELIPDDDDRFKESRAKLLESVGEIRRAFEARIEKQWEHRLADKSRNKKLENVRATLETIRNNNKMAEDQFIGRLMIVAEQAATALQRVNALEIKDALKEIDKVSESMLKELTGIGAEALNRGKVVPMRLIEELDPFLPVEDNPKNKAKR